MHSSITAYRCVRPYVGVTHPSFRLDRTHRLEFDAYKADYESHKSNASRDRQSTAKFDEATRKFETHKIKFEKLRDDVAVKLRFLDENKVSRASGSVLHSF